MKGKLEEGSCGAVWGRWTSCSTGENKDQREQPGEMGVGAGAGPRDEENGGRDEAVVLPRGEEEWEDEM